MSPEQATGDRDVDARTDVYALGCVLYEMLAGEPPFTGASAQAIVARVVTEQPRSLTTQRRTVPPEVEAAVFTALEKLPADRYATAAEFSAALLGQGPMRTTRTMGAAKPASPAARRNMAVAGTVAAVATVLALWGWFRAEPPRPVRRYSLGIPPTQSMLQTVLGINLAISPDGNRMVYLGPGDGGGQLWLRERDKLDATPITGTNGAINPFFSPDGQQIAFSAGAVFDLKVIPVSGGPAVTLAQPGPGSGGGAAWSSDGWIYFDTPQGLARIRSTGGEPEPFLAYDSTGGELGHAWPDVLPGGKTLLFRSRRNLEPDDFDLVALDVATRRRKVLTKGLVARYVEPGYVAFIRADGALMAAPFDAGKLELTGPAVPLLEGVMTKTFGSVDLAISPEGTLVYAPGAAEAAEGIGELVWVERDGATRTVLPQLRFTPSTNRSIALSPDGTRLAADVLGARGPDIRVKQLPSGPFVRLTFDGTQNFRPSWTADGKSVIWISNRDSAPASVWRQQADGARPPELVLRGTGNGIQEAVLSQDGKWLVFRTTEVGNRDIYAVRPGADTTRIPLLVGRFNEDGIALSPDGRWLAYTSDESGRVEVYVRPFPDVSSGRWQISGGGGYAAARSHSGRELFFVGPAGQMMVSEVRTSGSFQPGEPRQLIAPQAQIMASVVVPNYAITPDDKRFLMVRLGTATAAPGAGQLVVVDNWLREFRAKVRGR